MPDPTTNYGWNPPDVGADDGTWGTVLNALIDEIDADLASVDALADAAQATADAALPKNGGTMLGALNTLTSNTPATNLGSLSGPETVNTSAGQYHYGTVAGNTTFTFANSPVTGKAFGFLLELTNAGAYTITWPASVKWSGGSAPSLSASGVDLLVFITRDNGATWRGSVNSLGSA